MRALYFLLVLFLLSAPAGASSSDRASVCSQALTHPLKIHALTHELSPQLNEEFLKLTGLSIESIGKTLGRQSEGFFKSLEGELFNELRSGGYALFKNYLYQIRSHDQSIPSPNLVELETLFGHLFFGVTLLNVTAASGLNFPKRLAWPQTPGLRRIRKALVKVKEGYELCYFGFSQCSPYFDLLGKLYGAHSSILQNESNFFPEPPSGVPGTYVDLATGVLLPVSLSLPHFDRQREYVLVDNSPFVVSALKSLAALYDLDQVDVMKMDLSQVENVRKIKGPIALLRVKNVQNYVPNFHYVLTEMINKIGPGGRVVFLFDNTHQESRFFEYNEALVKTLLSQGWKSDEVEIESLFGFDLTRPHKLGD